MIKSINLLDREGVRLGTANTEGGLKRGGTKRKRHLLASLIGLIIFGLVLRVRVGRDETDERGQNGRTEIRGEELRLPRVGMMDQMGLANEDLMAAAFACTGVPVTRTLKSHNIPLSIVSPPPLPIRIRGLNEWVELSPNFECYVTAIFGGNYHDENVGLYHSDSSRDDKNDKIRFLVYSLHV